MRVELAVNGVTETSDVPPHVLLVEYLRGHRGLTGTKVGCETSTCGTCTVLLDGLPVKSCTMLVVQAAGAEVTTIEGLAMSGAGEEVFAAMRAEHAVQCGFCTPGVVVSLTALFDARITPSHDDILSALDGHLCRCTGYTGIVRAAQRLLALRRGEAPAPVAGTGLSAPLAVHDVTADGAPGVDVEVV